MKIFTIETETNNITVHTTAKGAKAVADSESFRDEAGLAKLAANWPAQRLIEIWNSMPGATPVKKFKHRNTAVARIWKAIQNLGQVAPEQGETQQEPADTAAQVTPQTPDVAPVAAPTKVKAARSKAPKDKEARSPTKASTILDLLKRVDGATLDGLMTATGWQAHSVSGFLSGTIRKKMGLDVISVKGENGERTYSMNA